MAFPMAFPMPHGAPDPRPVAAIAGGYSRSLNGSSINRKPRRRYQHPVASEQGSIARRSLVSSFVDVAIIGAGPYGLSVAAHLEALGVDYRIFGKPMALWRDHMPPGMRLKSDGASSDLADPADELTLKKFCAREGLAHHDTQTPVPLDTFTAYGMAFQKRFVPRVEERTVTELERAANGFALRLDDQDVVLARRVVVAIGVAAFSYLPEFLAGIDPEFVAHSSRYGSFDRLRGKEVLVMGSGASALDIAGLVRDQDIAVSVMTRRPTIEFHSPPGHRSLRNRLRAPNSGIGAGWQVRLFADEPRLFHVLPEAVRLRKAANILGPSAGWFMKDSIVGRVPIHTGMVPTAATVRNGRLQVTARTADGGTRDFVTDHLIAGTGYRIDLTRLGFLPEKLRHEIRSVRETPVLSRQYETSVDGLYFIGPATLNSFGPVARFVFGARYSARRLAPHLAAVLSRRPSGARYPAVNQSPTRYL
jgi:thioredoxin reductase